MKVLNKAQTHLIEQRAALQAGISLLRLMDNAGSAAARIIRNSIDVSGKKCAVVCGNGNNGGDGFVVARKLCEAGGDVTIILASGTPNSADAQSMLERTKYQNIPVFDAQLRLIEVGSIISSADIIVDGIFGIGFRDEVDGINEKLIDLINVSPAKVFSLDVPSGMHADDGTIGKKCVKAYCTVAFTCPKPAHLNVMALPHCGRVEIVDIGIPKQIVESSKSEIELIDTVSVQHCLPKRKFDSHKGDFGTLLAFCGSYGMPGAAVLSVSAAVRSGVGLAMLGVSEKAFPQIAPRMTEPVYLPLPALSNESIDFEASKPMIDKAMSKATCILIGCGMTTDESCCKLLEYVLLNSACPVVIDADGINILAENIDILQRATAPVIITPHPGEMARLLKLTTEQVQNNRFIVAKQTTETFNVTTVLKGAYTVIASPNGRFSVNASGNGGMASAGVGDVLAGIISAFVAQGLSPDDAAVCGVHIHSLAGDRCAEKYSQYGMTASDIVRELPLLFKSLGR